MAADLLIYGLRRQFKKSQPMEAYEPGKCPECGAPVQMHLKRTLQRQQALLINRLFQQ
jgi:hypothetical protein